MIFFETEGILQKKKKKYTMELDSTTKVEVSRTFYEVLHVRLRQRNFFSSDREKKSQLLDVSKLKFIIRKDFSFFF